MPLPDWIIQPLGDHALTLQIPGDIDPALHWRLQTTRQRLLERQLPGVSDVLVAYTSLTVYYDPYELFRAHRSGNSAFQWLQMIVEEEYRASSATPAFDAGRLHHIPVVYDGRDLPAVAAALHCSEADVIDRHRSCEYRVYLIGFLPGFPYLGLLPSGLALPRKARPEPVAAGSVAIAGRQTGIYPVDSPGGWHILGRTNVRLFDVSARPPVLLEPGDRVMFIQHDRL